MARIRKAVSYRRLERPYTRRSKYRALNYAKASPHNLIVKYVMGDATKDFPIKLELVGGADVQLRHNAVESARKSANKILEEKLGKSFQFRLRLFPHHILRENPLASGAGADRMSTGMKMSFGKPIGIAAQCPKGKVIAEVFVEEKDVPVAIQALKRMQYKFPIHCTIVQKNVAKEAAKKATAKKETVKKVSKKA